MKRLGLNLIFGLFLVFFLSSGAHAISFNLDSYSVNVHNSGPGLLINWAPVLTTPASMNLLSNVPFTVALFDIWTNETTVNAGEDTVPKPITVGFNFTQPSIFGGGVNGQTQGNSFPLNILGFSLPGFFQNGTVTWNGPVLLNFGGPGQNNDGILSISLSNETFNSGIFFGLHEGQNKGATVDATFNVTALPTASLPEPNSTLLFGSGLMGLALWHVRRIYFPSEYV